MKLLIVSIYRLDLLENFYIIYSIVVFFFYNLSIVNLQNILKLIQKVQIGNDQEMTQSETNSHSIIQGVGKN